MHGSILAAVVGNRQTMSKRWTHVNGTSQYSENIVATMLITIASFVSSVAVTSMNTFRVFKVILLCSELIIGGIDKTVRLVS